MVKVQKRMVHGLILLLLLFVASQSHLWAGYADLKSKRPNASSLSSGQAKKPSQEWAAGQKKKDLRKKQSDTKPMPPLDEAPFCAQVPLMPVIREAKARLAKERVRYYPGSLGKPARRELKLALADFTTGKIEIISGIEEKKCLFLSDPKIRHAVNWWNGFNSSIDILEPANTGIVGLLYALDPKKKSWVRREAIIYTPYSNALLQPKLVEAGRQYLIEKISQARKELHHAMFKAGSQMPLEKEPVFRDEDYFNLILAEHTDPEAFRKIIADQPTFDPDKRERLRRLIYRILVIIGANQEDAYKFTGNYASARGLAQFTRIGMRVVWNRYTDADISRDFIEATSNHLHSIKAEICLLDHYLANVTGLYPNLAGSGYEKYAAGACYNGGPRNVLYGLKNFGVSWLHPHQRLLELAGRASLNLKERRELEWLKKFRNHETFIYLNKMHAIESLQPSRNEDPIPPEQAHALTHENVLTIGLQKPTVGNGNNPSFTNQVLKTE
ncbi:MAG: hypothetical protein ABIJ44_03795 [Pseudomonadota bacterium]